MNYAADKLEAILELLTSAQTEQELVIARRQAKIIEAMPDEEIAALARPVQHARQGTFVAGLRTGSAWQYGQNSEPSGAGYADFLANLYNLMAEAGSEPDDEELETSTDELHDEGWTLDRNEQGLWVARKLGNVVAEKGPIQNARGLWLTCLQYAAERAPKGGVSLKGKSYKGGQFIPASVVANLSAEDRDKLETAKAEAENKVSTRKAAWSTREPINKEELAVRLDPYNKRHGLERMDLATAKKSWRMLKQHHGEHALNRVKDLMDQAEAVYVTLDPDNDDEVGLVNRLGKQLAIMRRIVGLAQQDDEYRREVKPVQEDPKLPPRLPQLALADAIAGRLSRGETLTAADLRALASEAYGGTMAEGKYGYSEATDAMEAGFNRSLMGQTDPRASLDSASKQAEAVAARVAQLPTQTNRSGEKETHQQFSTPPHYAFAAAWLANLSPEDVVLEPSAGTGCLAVQSANSGAGVFANELSDRRADFLRDLLGTQQVFNEDAEQISGILPHRGMPAPSVVVMNPPFSQTAGRMGNKKELMTGARHIDEAMRLLQPGGRLVAIVGRGMTPDSPTFRDWFENLQEKFDLRANVGVSGGEYKKYGTHFDTRILVIDKKAPSGSEPIVGDAPNIPGLMAMLEGVRNDRSRPTPKPPSESLRDGVLGASGGASTGTTDSLDIPAPGVSGSTEPSPDAGLLPAGIEGAGSQSGSPEESGDGSGAAGRRLRGTTGRSEEGSTEGGMDSPGGTSERTPRGDSGGKDGKKGGRGSRGKPVQQPTTSIPILRPAQRLKIEPTGHETHSPKPPEPGFTGLAHNGVYFIDGVAQKSVPEGVIPHEPTSATDEGSAELGASLYETYRPQLLRVEGAKQHTTPLVESAAMAAVRPPAPTYSPTLSPDIVEKGILSEAQLEALVYAGQAHESFLPAAEGEETVRRGYFIGDGTGVGKGREIAGILADNWNQGRKKAVWVSQKQNLLEDANRDWKALGMDPSNLHHFDDIRGKATPPVDGVAFITYDTLKGKPKDETAKSNLQQLADWLGPDFDGCIAFDEAHGMCLQKGTLIATPYGDRAIEDLRDGDTVLGYDHADGVVRSSSVTRTFSRRTSDAILQVGTAMMTGEHPVYTLNRGYIPAADIVVGDTLRYLTRYGKSTTTELRILQGNVQPKASSTAVLLQNMQCQGDGKTAGVQVCLVSNDSGTASGAGGDVSRASHIQSRLREESSCVSVFGSEPVPKSECDQEPRHGLFALAKGSHWERESDVAGSSHTERIAGLGIGVSCRSYPVESRVPEVLLHRSGGPCGEDRGGNRRAEPSSYYPTGEGPEENSVLGISRMDGSEVQELRRGEQPQAGSGDYSVDTEVFNIETSTGNYFANGLLVHNCNAIAIKGSRGDQDASKRAIAGMELQKLFPKARITYVSATGATEVSNLAYADRLGIWGKGTPFPGKENFIDEMNKGGVAAMEAVAQSLKAMGAYGARSLSFDDGTPTGRVEYDRVTHQLTPDQRMMYDAAADAWQEVLHNIDAALELTGGSEDKQAKSSAKSQFWGAQQRFFNQLMTSMQTPSVIREMTKDIEEGRAPVVQLVNTSEAALKRALDAREEGDAIEDMDLSTKQVLMQYLENSFPVHRYETYVDSAGNERTRLALQNPKSFDEFLAEKNIDKATLDPKKLKDLQKKHKESGIPIVDPEAMALRDEMMNKVGMIRIPEGPLDQIINHFGVENVAEATGRTQRILRDENGNPVVESRNSASSSAADATAFQAGKKKLLIFSDAGGTGRSYHADKNAENQKQRVHYMLQPGWRADNAVQGLGRTHRTNQASAPVYKLVEIDELKAQKRFISTIARRLDQLGALTKGERKAGGGGLFAATDNLEGPQARQAMENLFADLHQGKVQGLDYKEVIDQLGLESPEPKKDSGGRGRSRNKQQAKPAIPDSMGQFLNRLLSLRVDMQTKVFDAFDTRLQQKVDQAFREGTLDTGVENFQAHRITRTSDKVVYKQPSSGAEVQHLVTKVQTKTDKVPWEKQNQGEKPIGYFRNKESGQVYAAYPTADKTEADTGRVIEQFRLENAVGKRVYRPKIDLDSNYYGKFEKLDHAEAKQHWDAEYAEAPDFHESEEHFLTGAILPVWDRIPGEKPKIYRLKTDDGQTVVGRHVPRKHVPQMLKNMGIQHEGAKHEAKSVHQKLSTGRAIAKLANGWKLKPVRVQGERRIELTGGTGYDQSIGYAAGEELKKDGVIVERINYNTRYFVPTGAEGVKVLERITGSRPIADVEEPEQHSRSARANQYRRLASIARSHNDSASARIYTKQAQEALCDTPLSRQALHFQRCADSACIRGDLASARIFARQARLYSSKWDEGKHPRAKDGKFGSGTGSSTGESEEPSPATPKKGLLARTSEGMSALKQSAYDALPYEAQVVVDAGLAVEHHIEGYFKSGQELAKEVARERGLPEEHVDRVARALAIADGISRWTANVPGTHTVIEGVAHAAIHALGAVGGAGAFVAAKVGFYIPVASLAYTAYSLARSTLGGKNPVTTIKNARSRVKETLAKEHGHTPKEKVLAPRKEKTARIGVESLNHARRSANGKR